MLTRIHAAKCIGIDAVGVTVETDIRRGIGIHLVGMADVAVRESLLRVTTAMTSLGYRIPGRKIVINLAPADLRKSGSGYDLPIAMGIIAASSDSACPYLEDYLIMGELSLDGEVRYVPGAPLFAEFALRNGLKGVILPYGCAHEACCVEGVEVFGVRTLSQAMSVVSGECTEELRMDLSAEGREPAGPGARPCVAEDLPDMADIIGQQCAKRALEIAAAGAHNLIMVGPPGSGKSTLAKALAGILPPMTKEESMLADKIFSVSGKCGISAGRGGRRPFRAPHHATSVAAMIGGGSGDNILPGEVSLANNGVLFLDEFVHLPRCVIESLRGPLEDRKVTVSRLRTKVEFPASFMLVAASNPCPCGYYGEGDRCTCPPHRREEYLSRLSGPIMDRIDLQVFVRRVSAENLGDRPGERSAAVAARVGKARLLQAERFRGENILTNAEMNVRQIARYCPLGGASASAMRMLMDRQGLSMRAYHRIVRVARTIADLENAPEILPKHVLEAAGYRFLDKLK